MTDANGLDILFIGPYPTDETRIEGGVQASLHGLCRRLVASGLVDRVEVVATPKRVGGLVVASRQGGVDVLHLTAPWRFMISSVAHLPMILRRIRRSKGRVVHLHGTGLFELAVLAACRLERIPIVWTLHGITEKETLEAWRRQPTLGNRLRHFLYKGCERLQLRLAPILIVDTAYVAREVAPYAAAVPAAIPQGVETSEFVGLAGPREDGLVVSLGVIHPRKGHDRAIAAFARVVEKVPGARLEVIGSLTSPEHFDELAALVRRLGLERVVTLRPDLDRAEVLAALGRASLFALHSEEESQGIALCEAMAAGLPIVATRVGGIPDVIAGSEAGVLVPFGDIDGFADAIVAYLGDPETRTKAVAAAHRRARDFDWATIVGGIVDRYRLARSGRRDRRAAAFPQARTARPPNDAASE
ncbi:MAG: glycosyltransferase family 4 protein [Hyphomicrobiales bacterium]|nr:glycosyltransferase family 4 protein [Hyphomicrobiales bacterium]